MSTPTATPPERTADSPPRLRPGRLRGSGRAAVAALACTVALVAVGCATGQEGTAAAGAEGTASGGEGGTGGVCDGPRSATAVAEVPVPEAEPEPQLPVTVTDATGQSVTVEDASRILALDTFGTLGTTVYALGLGDRLVGRDISTGVPELADLPVVTQNGHELNAEAILELDPTVVLTDYSIGPLEVQLQLQSAGIPVVFLDSQRGRDLIGDQIRAVADALGVGSAGEAVAADVERRTRDAEAEVARWRESSGAGSPAAVFLYLRGNAGVYHWFGSGSGADDLIESLGATDVASEVGLEGTKPVTSEGLIAAAPELILVMSDGLSSVGGIDGLLGLPGVAQTPAGEARCVLDMADTQILSFGPQFPETLRSLGAALYGRTGTGS
jgi:iron complex transport system substrate-binding protein